MNKMITYPNKSIPTFYSGQSIFLTGATGFLGKVFIEKILRSCPDVREIFLLMRPKKELNIQDRLEEILKLPLYEKLRDERASNFKKLIPISGNVSEKELGLSLTDKQILIERVTIIIHCAASVKFNDSLKHAIFVNTRATRDICILAQSMKNLIALVYIGTAFAHVNNTFIDEKVYPPIANWQKMIQIAESLDEHTLNIFTAKCLDYAPNTYIFSKNLAESIIQKYSSSLPCAIVRPSMVTSSLKEPMPGWIDNIYGPIGLFIGGGKGLIRVAYCNKSCCQDAIPVDIVIKVIIVVTWKLGLTTNFTADSTPFVLNCTNQKHVTYQNIIKLSFSIANEMPLEGIVWTPHTMLTDNYFLFYVLTLLLHILPAILIDLILYSFGRRPMLVRLQRKIYVANCAVSYFSFHEWKYSKKNSFALMSSIPPDNREMFSFDFSYVDIKKYLKNSFIGGKQFFLHEDMSRLDVARTHSKRLVRLQKKIYVANCAVSYFSFHEWKYSNTNSFVLMSSIPPDNREMFSFDFSYVDIKKYLKNGVIGGKQFFLHEDMRRLDVAKAHSKRIYLFVTIVKTIISIGVLWVIYKWIYYHSL